MNAAEQLAELGKGVLMIGLDERHLTLGIGIAAQQVRNLLQNQDRSDCGQQSLDHAPWHEGGDRPGLRETEADLDQVLEIEEASFRTPWRATRPARSSGRTS